MIDITQIYEGAENFINQLLRKESSAQGHFLTGALEASLDAKISKQGKADIMDGIAAYYTQYVDQGFPAESASMKQFPFMVRYFQARGLDEKEAKNAAAATIKVWMKQGGMPTQASKRFSETGSRTNMISNAMVGADAQINEYFSNAFDFAFDEKYHETKSETI